MYSLTRSLRLFLSVFCFPLSNNFLFLNFSYQLGTGDTGASGAFASLACVYGAAGLASSQFMTKPPEGWKPEGYNPDPNTTENADIGVPASVALRTPQFSLLWATVFGNAVGGLALISSSKTIMMDIWAPAMPAVVTASFATGYVATLGSANSFGRLTWGAASDKLGRKNTYTVFALGLPVIAATPYLIEQSMESADPSVVPLAVFVGGSVFAITNYGKGEREKESEQEWSSLGSERRKLVVR